jgi:hypothetical protein
MSSIRMAHKDGLGERARLGRAGSASLPPKPRRVHPKIMMASQQTQG